MSDSGAEEGGLSERPEPLRVPVIDVTLRSSVVGDEPDAQRQLQPKRSTPSGSTRLVEPSSNPPAQDGASPSSNPPEGKSSGNRVSIAPVRVISDVPPAAEGLQDAHIPGAPANGVGGDEDLSLSAEVPIEEEVTFDEDVPEDPEAATPRRAAFVEGEEENTAVDVDPDVAETLKQLEQDSGLVSIPPEAGAVATDPAPPPDMDVPATPLPPPDDPEAAAAMETSQSLEVGVEVGEAIDAMDPAGTKSPGRRSSKRRRLDAIDEIADEDKTAVDEGPPAAIGDDDSTLVDVKLDSDAPEITVETEPDYDDPPPKRRGEPRPGMVTQEIDVPDMSALQEADEQGEDRVSAEYEELVVEPVAGKGPTSRSVPTPPQAETASAPPSPPPQARSNPPGEGGVSAPPPTPPQAQGRRSAVPSDRASAASVTPPPPPPEGEERVEPPSQETLTQTARVPEPKPSRPRQHQWWEVFFDDDYLRTVPRPPEEHIRRQCDFIQKRLGLAGGATLLDVGCGFGSHVVELSARGFLGVGLDLSLAMLSRAADIAQDRGQRINFLHADMREMNFDGTFDAVTCLGTTFGYFDDEVNRKVVEKLYNALKPGGVLLLDVVNRDHVIASQPNLVWFEGEGCVCMEESEFNFFTSRLHVKRTVILDDGKQGETEYSLRLYALHELGQMLHHQGFRVTEVSGREAVPGVFFGCESPRMLIVAERRHGPRGEQTGRHSIPAEG